MNSEITHRSDGILVAHAPREAAGCRRAQDDYRTRRVYAATTLRYELNIRRGGKRRRERDAVGRERSAR